MGAETILLGKLAIGLGCAALSAALLLPGAWRRPAARRFDAFLLGLLALGRLGLFGLLYLVLDLDVGGDVPHYHGQGRAALAGNLPYRDFPSSYAPLFPFVIGGIVSLWNSDRAIVLFAIAIELLSFPLWLAAARSRVPESVVRCAALLYATSPIPLLNVAMQGQNNVWHSALLAGSLCLLARRDRASGALAAVPLCASKLLAGLFAPVLWLFARERLVWLLGFAVPTALVYGAALAAAGVSTLHPLRYEAVRVTPGNVVFLATALGLDTAHPLVLALSTLLTLAALGLVLFSAWTRGATSRPAGVFHLITLVLLTFLVASKKSYTVYLVMAFFPLCLTLAATGVGPRLLLGFGAFGVLCSLEMSLWFRWLGTHDLGWLLSAALPVGVTRAHLWIFALGEIALIAGYAAWIRRAWRALFRPDASVQICE